MAKRLTEKELNRIKIAFNMDGVDYGATRIKDGYVYAKNMDIENLVNEVEALKKDLNTLQEKLNWK